MRVLFDGYWWSRGPLANRSVQRDLISTWAKDYPGDRITVAVRRDRGMAPSDLPEGASTVSTRLWPHAVSNIVELPFLARRVGADISIVHNYTPISGRAATFIHDTMFIDHPEWFTPTERLYFWPMLATAARARLVLTSSGTERDRIRRHAKGRLPVTAIGLGVPTSLATAAPVAPGGELPDSGYALCVGRLNIRKNLAAVIRGAIESETIDPVHPLLIVGSAEYSGRNAEIPREFQPAVAAGSIRFLGRISDPELAWLYQHAALVITLSLDEGFGLPAVEAALFGASLVASDIPVFRETVGAYADFVDPRGPSADVAAAIDRSWGHPPPDGERAAVTQRYAWSSVVRGLRDALVSRLD